MKHGFPFKSEYFSNQGRYVVLTPGNFFEEGGFRRNAAKDKCFSSSFPTEYLLSKGDLIVAMTEQAAGLLGSTALIPTDDKFLHNQRLGLITSTSDEVELEFIYHLFKTKSVREQIRLSSTGSKVKHTSPDRIYDVEVSLPLRTTQKRIASVLSALDAKIELNNQINAELEAMAKLLYDYWFVQFDFPMTAAQATSLGRPALKGKPYKSSGGKMVHNLAFNRQIPEGWETREVGMILAKEPKTTKIPNADYLESGAIPVIDQSKDYICGYTNDRSSIISGFPRIVFGDHTRILKFVNFDFARGADGTQVLASNTERLPPHLFYQMLKQIDLSSYGYARHFKFLKDQKIILPEEGVSSSYEAIAGSVYQMIKNHTFQNLELTQLRDWLLPMLMNGQVTVAD